MVGAIPGIPTIFFFFLPPMLILSLMPFLRLYQIPMINTGLKKASLGPPILDTRARGYNNALVAIMGSKDDLAFYAAHETHIKYVFHWLCIAEF